MPAMRHVAGVMYGCTIDARALLATLAPACLPGCSPYNKELARLLGDNKWLGYERQ
jgi:hypothetical protein